MNYYSRIKTLLEGLGQASTLRTVKSRGQGSIEGKPFETRDKKGNMKPSKNKASKYAAHMAKQFHRVRTRLKEV